MPELENPDNHQNAEPQARNHRDPRDPRNHLDANPLIKPFVVLALPGMYLFYKYNQYKRKRKENATRRLAEKELLHLNNKIVCVLGGNTRLGTFTGFLLKQNPLVSTLHLHGCSQVDNLALDLNFCDTKCFVQEYIGNHNASNAIKSADVILLLPTQNLKEDTPISERIMTEGKRICRIVKECTVFAPRAILISCIPPVSVTTPICANIFKKTHFYHPGRIIGSAAITQEKLLSKLEESEPELASCQEEECVICIHAKATMQTSPCGHQVVCRKCFVKTIQIAVSQRLLPLRCVICRAKILRLKTGPILPNSVSGYSVSSRSSSVPQSDSLYSVSSGGSSISSNSSASERCQHCLKDPRDPGTSKGCGGQCGLRQPITGAIRRSQKREMKKTLQDYHRPEKNHINRLPPIKEMSPLHAPPASTRIRCAQKIVTQLEMPIFSRNHRGQKYERLPLDDEDVIQPSTSRKTLKTPEETPEKSKITGRAKSPEILKTMRKSSIEKYKPLEQKLPENTPLKKWWADSLRSSKSEERIDNKKNEIMEKQMEMKEKISIKSGKCKNKEKAKLLVVDDESL